MKIICYVPDKHMLATNELLHKHEKSSSSCPYLFMGCPYSFVKNFFNNVIAKFTWPYEVCLNVDSRSFYQRYGLLSSYSKIRMRSAPLDDNEHGKFTKDVLNIPTNNPKCDVKRIYGDGARYIFIPSSCQELRDLLNKYATENN